MTMTWESAAGRRDLSANMGLRSAADAALGYDQTHAS
jgi:hypothetical protein